MSERDGYQPGVPGWVADSLLSGLRLWPRSLGGSTWPLSRPMPPGVQWMAEAVVITNRNTGYRWILRRGEFMIQFQTPQMLEESITAESIDLHLTVEEAKPWRRRLRPLPSRTSERRPVRNERSIRSQCWVDSSRAAPPKETASSTPGSDASRAGHGMSVTAMATHWTGYCVREVIIPTTKRRWQ